MSVNVKDIYRRRRMSRVRIGGAETGADSHVSFVFASVKTASVHMRAFYHFLS